MSLRKLRWFLGAAFRRHYKLIFLVTVALALSLGAIRFSSRLPTSELLLSLFSRVEYTEGLVGAPQTLNPLFVTTDTEKDLSSLLFRGLTQVTPDGQVVPDLAESWEVSSSAQVFLFHLKPNQRFASGEVITPEDIAFTYELARDRAVGSRFAEAFKDMEVQVIAGDSVLFRLNTPYAPFLTLTNLGILPKKQIEKINRADFRFAKLNHAQVTSTDFKFKALTEGQLVLTKGNVNYIFRFYKTAKDLESALKLGEIKAAGFTEAVSLKDWKNFQTLSSPLYQRFVAVFYNARSSATTERSVRQGLSYAINKDLIISDILSGSAEAVLGPLAPISWAKSEGLRKYEFDTKLAKSSLDRSGWTGGPIRQKDGKSLEIALSYRDTPTNIRIAQEIAYDWGEVGVRAILNPLSPSEFKRKVIDGKDFQAAILTQEVGEDPDQYVIWHTTQSDSGNLTGLKVPKLDKALEDARLTIESGERKSRYADFQRFLLDEAPVTFLYYPKYTFVVSNKVQGLSPKPLGLPSDRYLDISNWQVGRSYF